MKEIYLNRKVKQGLVINTEALPVVFKFLPHRNVFILGFFFNYFLCLDLADVHLAGVFLARLYSWLWTELRAQCPACPWDGQGWPEHHYGQSHRANIICSWFFHKHFTEQKWPWLFLPSAAVILSLEDSSCEMIPMCVNWCLFCHSRWIYWGWTNRRSKTAP